MGAVISKHHKIIALIGGASLLSALIYYLFNGQPPQTQRRFVKKPRFPILGLQNLRNTCYVNAILQAMASCKRYREWVLCIHANNNLSKSFGSTVFGCEYPSIAVFNAAFEGINRETNTIEELSSTKIPFNALKVIRIKLKGFRNCEENDAHEYFEAVNRIVNEETLKIKIEKLKGSLNTLYINNGNNGSTSDDSLDGGGISISPTLLLPEPLGKGDEIFGENNCDKKDDSKPKIVTRIKEEVTKAYYSTFMNPFIGFTGSHLQCIACQMKYPVKMDPFISLVLSLPTPNSGIITLNDLIDKFFKTTLVTGVNCDRCSIKNGKTTKSTFAKKTSLARLPSSICFLIQRITWSNSGNLEKRFESIRFPEILNLSSVRRLNEEMVTIPIDDTEQDREIKVSKLQNSIFTLRAVICHQGDAYSGHFITYRRASLPYEGAGQEEGWYLTNDMEIQPVKLSDVLLSNAYMLFYERPHKS